MNDYSYLIFETCLNEWIINIPTLSNFFPQRFSMFEVLCKDKSFVQYSE